jgi:hypothetical protein
MPNSKFVLLFVLSTLVILVVPGLANNFSAQACGNTGGEKKEESLWERKKREKREKIEKEEEEKRIMGKYGFLNNSASETQSAVLRSPFTIPVPDGFSPLNTTNQCSCSDFFLGISSPYPESSSKK